MSFKSLKGNCPICAGARKDCRQSAQTGRIHCRLDNQPPGYDSFGADEWGFNMYKVTEVKADDDRGTPLSLSDRDHQYRNHRSFLTNKHKSLLRDRGLTDAQIDWLHEQRWIRSWARGQSTKLDRALAGIDPKTGETLGCDGIGIAGLLNGKITGYQIANDDRRSAKYLWLSSASQDGASPHMPNGDLPLAAWVHPEIQPTEMIVCEGFLKSLVTAIRLWAQGKTEYMVVGAAGGNFGASAQTTRDLLNQYQITSVLLAPDAGVIHHEQDDAGQWLPNENVLKAYDRTKSVCAGREFNVLWWGQNTKKDGKDIDELSDRDLTNLGIISWDEFQAMVPKPKEAPKAKTKPDKGKSNADVLSEILDRCEVWQTDDRVAWVDVPQNGFKEPIPLESPGFKAWFADEFRTITGRCCSADAMSQVLLATAGLARRSPTHEIHHRTASHNGKTYFDLGTQDRKIVEICGAGWRILEGDCPVKFHRPATMKALPIPNAQADWTGLRKILNLEEGDWILLLAWLSWGLFPDRPHPLLVVNGEHGSGKSKTCELLKRLIDPAKALLLSLPREEGDLMAHALNRWCLVYDNLSGLSNAMSDSLCRLATGGGIGHRKYYTNGDESVFEGVRPIILNGIEALATRPDLLDRSIILNLPPIEEGQRMTEDAWENALADCQSAVLGSLLDALSHGLRHKNNVRPINLTRMADFHLWGHAVEGAFGFAPGAFEIAYRENRERIHQAAIDNDAIATHILMLMERQPRFQGTASQLLAALNEVASEEQRRSPDWIKSPRVLGRMLVRLAPELRKCGVEARTGLRAMGQRLVVLEYHPLEAESPPPDLPVIEESISYEYTEPEQPDAPLEVGETVAFRESPEGMEFNLVAINGEACTIEFPNSDGPPSRYISRLDWLTRLDTSPPIAISA